MKRRKAEKPGSDIFFTELYWKLTLQKTKISCTEDWYYCRVSLLKGKCLMHTFPASHIQIIPVY